jgi:hypothetical protein
MNDRTQLAGMIYTSMTAYMHSLRDQGKLHAAYQGVNNFALKYAVEQADALLAQLAATEAKEEEPVPCCAICGELYQAVRPGKWQSTCEHEPMRHPVRDQLQSDLAAAQHDCAQFAGDNERLQKDLIAASPRAIEPLERLKALEAKATPGPWSHYVKHGMVQGEDDTRLISALRNLAPELLALWGAADGDWRELDGLSLPYDTYAALKSLNAKAKEVML